MASYVSSQGVGESLFCPSKGENARVRRGERRPVGGRPDLSPIRAAALMFPPCYPVPGRRRWGMALGACWGAGKRGGVRTRGWGRGPARRGLTLGALDLTL